MKSNDVMTTLSPAAQAVLDAVDALYEEDIPEDRIIMATTLRTVADQVVPEDYDPPTKQDEFVRGMVAGKTLRNMDVRAALYRIATELENK